MTFLLQAKIQPRPFYCPRPPHKNSRHSLVEVTQYNTQYTIYIHLLTAMASKKKIAPSGQSCQFLSCALTVNQDMPPNVESPALNLSIYSTHPHTTYTQPPQCPPQHSGLFYSHPSHNNSHWVWWQTNVFCHILF